ncbi:MAG TPA: PqqD family peptide modification chaperone [Thermoanaerobaculia bacterium]|nr:PqqD family peptide modification chaperone [Thermoanaerobaculia bacterium]
MPEKNRIELESVVVASKEQLASSIGGETVILGLQSGRYYGVDRVSARVWQIIQEPRRVADICNAIVTEYEVDPHVCEADILALLRQMADGHLIEVRAALDS